MFPLFPSRKTFEKKIQEKKKKHFCEKNIQEDFFFSICDQGKKNNNNNLCETEKREIKKLT